MGENLFIAELNFYPLYNELLLRGIIGLMLNKAWYIVNN